MGADARARVEAIRESTMIGSELVSAVPSAELERFV